MKNENEKENYFVLLNRAMIFDQFFSEKIPIQTGEPV